MKNIFSILVLSLIFFQTYMFAQIDDFCGTELLARESLDLTQQGGIYLTSQNEIKVLVVFVRFKDDNS